MTAGIILAAGVSSRMGSFKPLLPIGDTIFIRRLIMEMRNAGVIDIIIVTGYRQEELIEAAKDLNVQFVENKRYYETQMLDSVKIGMKRVLELYENCTEILLSPADVVMTPPWVFEQVLNAKGDFVRPMFEGEPGHPVLIRSTLFQDILEYQGDRGLRGAVEASGKIITELVLDEPAILLDADTKEDYQKVLHKYDKEAGRRGRLHPDIELKLATDRVVCGEGFMQILELVQSTGSLQNAARAMKMSYTKIWKVVKSVESLSGKKLIERESGGENGGGSYLTEHGEELLRKYKKMRRELDASVIEIFDRYFSDFSF